MILLPLIGLLAAPLLSLAANSTISQCQYLRPQGQQLQGCLNGTLYVSQTDPQAGYGTIQAACSNYPTIRMSLVEPLLLPLAYRHEAVTLMEDLDRASLVGDVSRGRQRNSQRSNHHPCSSYTPPSPFPILSILTDHRSHHLQPRSMGE